MQSEIKNCQNCKNDFIIEIEDFNFYEKIKVPPPTWCPDCRHQRRLAIRNERVFYYRKCDSCQERILSYYHPDKKQIVWCPTCWWSDKLDPFIYGRDFDFSKPFFEQFKELNEITPTLSLDIVNCKDSEYVSYCGDDNFCYFDIAGERNEYCYFCKFVKYSKDCIDCSFVYNSELNYECVNCHKVYGSSFLDKCTDCSSCHLMYDCRGCTDCFGCWNLRNKSYYIFNKPYSREEYKKIVSNFNRKSFSALEKMKREFKELSKNRIVKYATLINSPSSTGDDIFNCKNMKESFDVSDAENGKWLCDVLDAKECYDIDFSLYKPSFNIELISTLNLGNSGFCSASHYSNDIWYSNKCNNSSDLFGCVAVNKKKYCILNKQYDKEEYENLKEKIITDMRKRGEYGKFLPYAMSAGPFNFSTAFLSFPETKKEDILKLGGYWEDILENHIDGIQTKDLPDDIKDVPDEIITKALICPGTGWRFNIAQNELIFYKQNNIPLPRYHFDVRIKDNMKYTTVLQAYPYKCFYCKKEINAYYPPEWGYQKIACEECYKQNIN